MTKDLRERVAQLVYERGMLYLRTELPAWTPGGNSLAQDESRAVAALILDHALAMVADERDACAEIAIHKHDIALQWASTYLKSFDGQTDSKRVADEIRARTDADAQAALERRDARIRNEALREAAAICDEERHNINALTSNPPQSAACVAAQNRIFALMEEKNDGPS